MKYLDSRLARTMLLAIGLALMQAPAQAEDFVYVARNGDTLISVAREWIVDGASWKAHRALARHNGLKDADRIGVGTQLRIPLEWLRRDAMAGRIKRAQGSVTSGGVAVVTGSPIAHGADLRTGSDGYATIELADGSELSLRPDSELRLTALQRLQKTGALESIIRLIKGAVDAIVTPSKAPGARFEVNTEQAIAAIRGTEFRLDASASATRNEVLKGTVEVYGRNRTQSVMVEPGFGTVVDATQKPLPPVRLLGAPDLSPIPALHERVLVRLRFAALPGAQAYRVTLSRNADFSSILRQEVIATSEARFADLPDAQYHVRVRGIDANRLEGLESSTTFRLKARPEPPFPSAPAQRGKVRGVNADFNWSNAAEAASYRIQIARDAAFADMLIDRPVRADRFTPEEGLKPAVYHWRVASVRADGDQGPWGDAQQFTMLPPPPAPEPPAVSDGKVRFSWSSEPGQTFLFQMARDEKFTDVVQVLELKEPTVELAGTAPGRYFMRYRATDPDGFVGPFSSAQSFEIPQPEPNRPWWLLLLLVPFL